MWGWGRPEASPQSAAVAGYESCDEEDIISSQPWDEEVRRECAAADSERVSAAGESGGGRSGSSSGSAVPPRFSDAMGPAEPVDARADDDACSGEASALLRPSFTSNDWLKGRMSAARQQRSTPALAAPHRGGRDAAAGQAEQAGRPQFASSAGGPRAGLDVTRRPQEGAAAAAAAQPCATGTGLGWLLEGAKPWPDWLMTDDPSAASGGEIAASHAHPVLADARAPTPPAAALTPSSPPPSAPATTLRSRQDSLPAGGALSHAASVGEDGVGEDGVGEDGVGEDACSTPLPAADAGARASSAPSPTPAAASLGTRFKSLWDTGAAYTHARTHAHTLTHTLSLSHIHTHTLSLSQRFESVQIFVGYRCYTHARTHTRTLTHSLTHSLSLSLTHSLTHTYTHTHSLSQFKSLLDTGAGG